MKGILFYDRDLGRGGPDGFLAHYQTWCVEIDGKKVHIHSDLTGSPGFSPERGGPTREVRVEPCDASCTRLVDVNEQAARKALVQIETEDRSFTPQEKQNLPSELAGATYLSELVESYSRLVEDRQRMMRDYEQERRKAHAGYDLFCSIKYTVPIKYSILRWFLKDEISRYEEATQ